MDTRGIFCNRTLNMRAIRAIGYDMDYTLIHYQADEWERRAYSFLKERFLADGWPVSQLEFNPKMVCRGLIIDTDKGNLIKANRFGFVKHALHGTKRLDFEVQREMYSRTIVELSESRWIFLNTLFSLSEGCMYSQLVDLLDQRVLPEVMGYADLYRRVKSVLDAAHMEGRLKAEILADPNRFAILDAEIPLTLLDQKHAGKKLMLITNSEWSYTHSIMSFAFDGFLPKEMKWRELFDLVVVGARKPDFFTEHSPFFEVVTEDGLLKPMTGNLRPGAVYLGGSAQRLEKYLGLSGDEILYVGDHMFGDVKVTKNVLRWRTALVIRELEDEIRAVAAFRPDEAKLAVLMQEKEALEKDHCQARIALQRVRDGYGSPQAGPGAETETKPEALSKKITVLRSKLDALDVQIAPLAKAAGELSNSVWGLLMRAGNDKSHLARQMERYADIYMSRVSNLMFATPYVYLRSSRGSLPHDPGITGPVDQYTV